MNHEKLKQSAKNTIAIEARCIADLAQAIDEHFVRACELLHACRDRIIIIGMGKSGHIGSKIAATLASTGSPAFFIHPAEASHGDLGMITAKDTVIMISNSGETEEILSLIPTLKLLGIPIISLTGNPESTLAKESVTFLNIRVAQEACPLQLAPTSSTTATLVMGDALAIALLEMKGFTPDDFARTHPGGTLGKRLFLRCESLMRPRLSAPIVQTGTPLTKALTVMTDMKLGHLLIEDSEQKLQGIYSDGDVRRTLMKNIDISTQKIDEVMTKHPRCVAPTLLATEALRIMEEKKITALPVVNEQGLLLGLLHIHDILRAGIAIT